MFPLQLVVLKLSQIISRKASEVFIYFIGLMFVFVASVSQVIKAFPPSWIFPKAYTITWFYRVIFLSFYGLKLVIFTWHQQKTPAVLVPKNAISKQSGNTVSSTLQNSRKLFVIFDFPLKIKFNWRKIQLVD